MKDLNFELKQLCLRNKDGGYATQAQREKMLNLMANQLHALGYRKMGARSLKPKHVQALVTVWCDGDARRGWAPVTVGTFKNRMTALRWWARKVNKSNVVAKRNDAYGVGPRRVTVGINKAISLDEQALIAVRDDRVRACE